MADFEPNPRSEPTLISGTRESFDLNTSRVVVDMEDSIHFFQPEATPFLTMTGRVKGKRLAKNVRFEWLEKDFKPRRVQILAAETDVATAIELVSGDGSKVAVNDLLQNTRTGELFLVTANGGADDLTVTRGIGGAGVAMVANDVCVILGSSYPDNSLKGTQISVQEYARYNYVQIFRTPFDFTGRDLVTELYGQDDKTTETRWHAMEHKKSIEFSLMFGKRHLIAAAGGVKTRTFTGGLDPAIVTNQWDVTGVDVTKASFDDFLEEALRWGPSGTYFGSGKKVFLCSSKWVTKLNSFVNNQLQYMVLDKQIGFRAMKYVSAHGDLTILRSPILDEFHSDRAYVLDFNLIDYVTLRKRDTRLLSGREENDRDGEAYEFMTDCGLLVKEEHAHAKVVGLGLS
jgi:hypothetical protein